MNLVDEQDTRHQLGDPLINILIDNFINLLSQLLCDFCLFRLHDAAHKTSEVTTSLGLSIADVQVMQSDVLHDFLLLVHVSLGQRYVLLSL